MTYKEYLQSRRYKKKTIAGYLYHTDVFLKWLEAENLTLDSCQYSDLLSYAQQLKKDQGKRPGTKRSHSNLNAYIRGVKYYYDYLEQIGATKHNPAQKLKLRGRTLDLPADLLSKEEMEKLYKEYPTDTPNQKRNKCILSLIIYQGLQEREIANLTAQDINLEKGTIKIEPSSRSNGRTLKLEAIQILPLQEFKAHYLLQMKEKNIKHISWQLSDYLKKHYPNFKNLKHLRTSLISYWTTQHNLREVQYMAGHKNLVSTEVYKHVNLEDLKKALDQYHPLR